MNLHDILANVEKPVSTKSILKENGTAILMKIKKESLLDKHQSRTNALLVLLSGKAVYKEDGRTIELSKVHDFVNIPEKVSHSVLGIEDSILLLIH